MKFEKEEYLMYDYSLKHSFKYNEKYISFKIANIDRLLAIQEYSVKDQ